MQSESQTFNAEKPPKKAVFQRKVVGVQGLEPWASCSQSRRATNCATPRYEVRRSGWAYSPKSSAIPTSLHPDIQFLPLYHGGGENQRFSVCGHSCGQSRFCAAFGNRRKSRKRRCYKAFRRFTLLCPGYRHGTPKASALPTALHPDTVFTLHRKSVFDSPNSILDFGRKVNRPVAYPARIAYNKNITQYIKERAL